MNHEKEKCPSCGKTLFITQYDDGHGNKRDCCYHCEAVIKADDAIRSTKEEV